MPLENIRKTSCFQGVWKENIGLKWVKYTKAIGLVKNYFMFSMGKPKTAL